MNLFLRWKMASIKHRFIPASLHPFCLTFVFLEKRKNIYKENCRRQEKKNGAERKARESWGNCNLKFIWQINFMASCIAVDPVRARETFIFFIQFFDSKKKKEIYAILKIWMWFKCCTFFLILYFIDTPDVFFDFLLLRYFHSWRFIMKYFLKFAKKKVFNIL